MRTDVKTFNPADIDNLMMMAERNCTCAESRSDDRRHAQWPRHGVPVASDRVPDPGCLAGHLARRGAGPRRHHRLGDPAALYVRHGSGFGLRVAARHVRRNLD